MDASCGWPLLDHGNPNAVRRPEFNAGNLRGKSDRLESRFLARLGLEGYLNGFVFVLIGLQLPSVLEGVSELSVRQVILYGALFSVFLILLRLIWTFPGAYIAHLIRRRILHQNEAWPGSRQVFVVGWTGMRGVIALAAAISLPETVAGGSPFPHRDLIVFLTFTVILATLVFQGLTLPPLIRALGLAETPGPGREEQEGRRLVLEAALARLKELRRGDASGSDELVDDLTRHYMHRLASVSGVSRALLDVERQTALRLRGEGRITDEALRELEHELDLDETRLIAATNHRKANPVLL